MTKKRISLAVISILLILTMLFSLTVTAFASELGYYHGRAEQKLNEFSYSHKDTKIRIIEPNWDPLTKNSLRPGQTFVKDPKVKNESDVEGYAVISVEIPVIIAKQEGTFKYIEQFTINWNTESYRLLKEGYKRTDKGIRKVYYWGLNKTLVPLEYSAYLFEKVKVNSYTVLEQNSEDDITINASLFPISNGLKNVTDVFNASGSFYPNDLKDTVAELL